MSAVRVVWESRPLSPDDVTDRLGAIADTYATSGSSDVVVADGFGVRFSVHSGALVVVDGVGEHRRERHYAKVSAPTRLIVAGDGVLSTEALAWCRAQGCAVVVIHGGGVLLAASPPGRDDARLRRAQALAAGTPAGLAIVVHLLTMKLTGQAKVLREIFGATEVAETVDDLAAGLALAEDVDEARQLEAVAAAAYFSTWCEHPATAVGFLSRDRRRVPAHWTTFDSRRSAITGAANTNRLAERPINALLNYCYRLAEVEARFACVRLGLDPAMGVLHADAPGRDSLALDLIEAVRPGVDRFVLDLIAERTFQKREFVERADGHVRVAAPLTHELAATLPTWRRAVAPVAESVAHRFVDQVTGKITPTTPLTAATVTAAQAAVRRRKAAEARARAEQAHGEHRAARATRRPRAVDPERAATGFARCVQCGGPLARSRHVRCPTCWEGQPAQSREARRRRGRSIAMARSELDAWRAEHPHAQANPADFAPVLAGLAPVTLRAIMDACSVSKATASGWRSGRHVPALMHWPVLAELAGVAIPAHLGSDGSALGSGGA